jgi:hypothetical protein
MIKFRIMDSEFVTDTDTSAYHLSPFKQAPIEHFFINEFPFNSAFCYLFRKYKCTSPIEDCRCCFCPKRPDLNYQTMGTSEGEGYKRINCRLKPDGKHKSIPQLIEEVKAIPIVTIMKFLQKCPPDRTQLRLITNDWFFHVWHRVVKANSRNTNKEYLPEYQL